MSQSLFPELDLTQRVRFPQTRYQGSKRKLADVIVAQLSGLPSETVLDGFGGTGSVAYAFKRVGKKVTYNDNLAFNHQIGLALIENDRVRLAPDEIDRVCTRNTDAHYGDWIERTFAGVYFTDEENRWLDSAIGNIGQITCPLQRAVAWYALIQSALVKRPYNLFHRRNLYMRTAEVERSFGNKAAWDRSFESHFRHFAGEANAALVDSGGLCSATCMDVMKVSPEFDLVYFDPPYVNRAGVGVDYRNFYHFLEGMVRYADWPAMIDWESKHLRLAPKPDPWSHPRFCREMFQGLFQHFRECTLVVSYRSDGTPTVEELRMMLHEVKRSVCVTELEEYQYALSTNRRSREMLLIGTD